LVDLGAAIAAGYLVGKLLEMILGTPWPHLAKTLLILAAGYGIFAANTWLIGFSHDNLPFEIHIEPLLVAMIGGFMVTNFTAHRNEFDRILHDVGPLVYVAFFALTGVALKLDILWGTLPIAVALFVVRALGISLGAFSGARLAGESRELQRFAGIGLITQAGIALGLAREAAVEFPALGDSFATMIISVVVLNEIFGPMFLKTALNRTGEAAVEEDRTDNRIRDVLIFGIEPQSLELARQLQQENWRVVMADTDKSHVDRLAVEDVEEVHLPDLSPESIGGLLTTGTDAVVAMLESDDENLAALELACQKGVPRLVVRLNDLRRTKQFRELGALVIDPASAMVNLLDQTVRAPKTAAVLLHQDSGRDLVQITVRNPDVDGMLLRDLRLPTDVLFMDVTRDGNIMMPSGYTQLRLNDEVTLIGRGESLQDAIDKLTY
jgi:Trk K+ transport system NAD-binding subunit